MKKDSKILIIGGGFAGARIAQDLAKENFKDITLVDKKDYFEVTYAALRSLVDPKLGEKSRIYYKDFIKANFVQNIVEELTENSAILKDGSIVEFDNVIIATGSSYNALPLAKSQNEMTLKDRNVEIIKSNNELNNAKNILIVGGGIVGVELAGEISEQNPYKSVTLVQNSGRLLEELTEKSSKTAHDQLTSLGVKVIYNKRIEKIDPIYQNSDIIYMCVGVKPNTALMGKNFSKQLDEKGLIKVNSYMQIEGYSHMYAIGDCANVPEGKLGYLADQQAIALAKNIVKQSNDKKMKEYKAHPMMSLVPVGSKQGFVQLPFCTTTLSFMVNMKQKDMFITKEFSSLGIPKK